MPIDGCAVGCAKRCLEQEGFSDIIHIELGALGIAKGKVEDMETSIKKVIDHVETLVSKSL